MSLVEMLGHLWSMRGEISQSTIWEKWNACIGLRLYILFNFLYFQGIPLSFAYANWYIVLFPCCYAAFHPENIFKKMCKPITPIMPTSG